MRGKCEEVTEAPPLDFVQYWKDMKNVTVPPFVESCYHMYGRTIPFDNRPNTPYSDLIGFAFAKGKLG